MSDTKMSGEEAIRRLEAIENFLAQDVAVEGQDLPKEHVSEELAAIRVGIAAIAERDEAQAKIVALQKIEEAAFNVSTFFDKAGHYEARNIRERRIAVLRLHAALEKE
jgi:hypothetical protein